VNRPVIASCIRKNKWKGKRPAGYVERECANPECRAKLYVSNDTAAIPDVMCMCNQHAREAAEYLQQPGRVGIDMVRRPDLFAANSPTAQILSQEEFWRAQRLYADVPKVDPKDIR
jgi:hypothetical protein